MGVVDLDGKDIAVLKKKRGQHVALLIQQKNESNHYVWKYYSVNGDNLYNLRGMHYGGRLYDDLGEHEYTSVQEFWIVISIMRGTRKINPSQGILTIKLM